MGPGRSLLGCYPIPSQSETLEQVAQKKSGTVLGMGGSAAEGWAPGTLQAASLWHCNSAQALLLPAGDPLGFTRRQLCTQEKDEPPSSPYLQAGISGIVVAVGQRELESARKENGLEISNASFHSTLPGTTATVLPWSLLLQSPPSQFQCCHILGEKEDLAEIAKEEWQPWCLARLAGAFPTLKQGLVGTHRDIMDGALKLQSIFSRE